MGCGNISSDWFKALKEVEAARLKVVAARSDVDKARVILCG